MKVEDVKRRVGEIAARADFNDQAHSMEDSLHSDVLRAIASGTAEDPVACAREALRTEDLEFERWFA